MKGLGISHYVFVHSIVCQWLIGVGSALVFTFVFDMGIAGLYFGYGNGLLVLCVCNLYYICKAKWDMIEMQGKMNWSETLNMNLEEDNFVKSKLTDDKKALKYQN